MDKITLFSALIGSAAFGAVAGKIIEAFLLAPISDHFEKKRWLRQTKLDAYTKLTEEILSLGLQRKTFDDPWKFKAISAKAILLIQDKETKKDIEEIIENIYKLSYDPSSIATSNLPDDFTMTLPGGKKATKTDLERGFAVEAIGKDAIKVTNKLGEDLRNT